MYFWPDWRDGIVRFLKEAGFHFVYAGNFVDQEFYETQEEVNECTWIFPGDLARESMLRVAEKGEGAEAIVVTGMPNWRNSEGLPERTLSVASDLEARLGMPIVSSDYALHWRVFKTLAVAPIGRQPRLLSLLQNEGDTSF